LYHQPTLKLRCNDDSVLALLRFLYGHSNSLDKPEWHDRVTLTPHVKVYLLAKSLFIEGLEEAVIENVSKIMNGAIAELRKEQVDAVKLLTRNIDEWGVARNPR